MVRNDIHSYSTSNEQNNINQCLRSNNENVEGMQEGVYEKIPDHPDLK